METCDKRNGDSGLLEKFIFGENNLQIKELAECILRGEQPERPILITGEQGTGKTYLLNGLCLAYHAKGLGRAVKISGVDFVGRMVDAIRFGDEGGMQAYFGEYDLILIDDIDDLREKKIVLKSFFELIGHLSHHAIVIMTTTGELETAKIGTFMRRQIKEMHLYPLGKELFLEMMDNKFVSAGVKLSRKQREFLYVRSNKSVRSFDGVYNKIILNCKVHDHYELSMNDLMLYTRP